jgi:uncharacterized iron-regulated membrane protein
MAVPETSRPKKASWLRQPQQTWTRRAMFQLHLWAGLILGVYIVVVCISGSVLVFRNDIYDVFEHWFREGTATPNTPLVRSTYLLMRWCGDLHGRLLLNAASGMQINAIGGFLTAAVCVTGLVIWWPGITRWRRALIVRSDVGWKRLNFDLHSALGFWTFLILFMWGITGGYFVFPEPFRAVINYFTPIDAPRVATKQVTPVRAGEFKAPPSAQAAPSPANPSKTVAAASQATAAVSQPAGNAKSSFPPAPRRRRPLTKGGRILQWFSFLHYGNFAGWPLKALWTLLGFAPALLFGTALVMWWNRVLSPALRRSRRSRAEWTKPAAAPELEWKQE